MDEEQSNKDKVQSKEQVLLPTKSIYNACQVWFWFRRHQLSIHQELHNVQNSPG